MVLKVIIGIAVFVALAIGALSLYVEYMDRQMDPAPLVARLETTPVPADGMVLVDEYSIQGSWLIKPRSPEANREFVAAGPVDEACGRIDDYYHALGMEVSTLSRSNNPSDWCGFSITGDDGPLHVTVEPINSWTEVPELLTGREDLVEIHYSAYRD